MRREDRVFALIEPIGKVASKAYAHWFSVGFVNVTCVMIWFVFTQRSDDAIVTFRNDHRSDALQTEMRKDCLEIQSYHQSVMKWMLCVFLYRTVY